MARKGRIKWIDTALKGVAVLAVLGVLQAIGQFGLPVKGTEDVVPAGLDTTDRGWGEEALRSVGTADGWQLIPLANACGLGASSCFRCHNGKRAGKASPVAWHTEHEKVNNSCVACHGGNPRLMKEKLSHRGMVLNPLTNPEKYCFECHTDDKAQAQLDKYKKLRAEAGEHEKS
jgi:hypothetical protein